MKFNKELIQLDNPLKDIISLVPESGSIVVNRQFLDALQARLFSSGIVCEEPGDIHRAFTTLIDIKIFAWDDSGTNLIKRGKNGN